MKEADGPGQQGQLGGETQLVVRGGSFVVTHREKASPSPPAHKALLDTDTFCDPHCHWTTASEDWVPKVVAARTGLPNCSPWTVRNLGMIGIGNTSFNTNTVTAVVTGHGLLNLPSHCTPIPCISYTQSLMLNTTTVQLPGGNTCMG